MKCPKRKMHSEMYPVKSVHGPGHLVLDDVEGENQSEGERLVTHELICCKNTERQEANQNG